MHVKDPHRPIAVLLVFFAVSTLAAERQDVGRDHQALQRIPASATLGEAFGLSRRETLSEARSITDLRGVTHTHYEQTYLGVPVWGERLVVGRDNRQRVTYTRGVLIRDLANDIADVVPGLSSDYVLSAMKDIAQLRSRNVARLLFQDESSDLVIYLHGKTAKLAFAVRFFADTFEGGQPTRPTFLVDANSGQILFEYEGLAHTEVGTGPGGNEKTGQYLYGADFGYLDVDVSDVNCTMNNANVKTVDLNHGTTGSTAFSYNCPENTYKAINGAYSPLNDAHFFGGVVYDMYNDWIGMPPLTFQLTMRVHYSTDYENAFWNGSSMTFGDGDTRFFPLVSLDVSAHEVSHGFTELNSGLIYSDQSGGINESFSDIAGEAAEMYMRGSADFETGADIFKAPDEALRYMYDPPFDGVSIDHTDDYYSGLDVHYSSGIFNKAFYLLATTGPEPWGVQKAFELFAKANQMYWTPGETFNTAFDGLITAAADLGYSADDVTAAFAAVGVPVPPPDPACDSENTTALGNGESSGKQSAPTGEWKCWTLDVPAGASTLDVLLRDTSKRNTNGGDADLYIKHGSSPVVDTWSYPPTGDFDCGSYLPNSDEQCSIPNSSTPPEPPAEGTWYFAVYAWSTYPSVTLTGTYAPDTGEPPPPTEGITVTAREKGGRNNKFVQVQWEGATSSMVDIHRTRDSDGWTFATPNDGSFRDSEGRALDAYQVCEAGSSSACSEPVTAN